MAADAPGLSVEALARQMNVAGGPTESPWPKNVGLLFFNEAPESVTAKHKVWRYYIRRYSSTVEAKGENEQELLSLAAKVPFDDRYNQSARIDDLSKPLMQAFLQEVDSALAADAPGLSVDALARQMNVTGGPTESPWPKNVGLLFFNETPERFFPGVQIDVVWFPEGAGGIASKKRSSRARWLG